MDLFVLKALVGELQRLLPGAFVSKVFQMSRDDMLLRLWRGQDMRLFLSTHPTLQRLHLTEHRFDNPQRPPRFAAFLRAHLQQVRVHNITVQPYDRVVYLTWERTGGPSPVLTLIHELTGPHANIILVDGEGIILDALKHVPADAKHQRSILPGQCYTPLTPPPHRLRFADVTPAHLQHLSQQGHFDVGHLQRLLMGVSPILIRELLHRSQGQPEPCWELLQHVRQQYEEGTLSLSLCTTVDGTQHLTVLPITYECVTTHTFSSAQAAMAACYETAMLMTLTESVRRDLQKTLRQRQHKLQKKVANLQQDYEKLQGYLPYQHYGTLLVAQRLPRGTASATVVDYYSPAQATITIPLDPRLSGQENAQTYFKKYRKAKSGMTKVQAFLTQAAAAAEALEEVALHVEYAEDWQTLQGLADAVAGERTAVKQQRTVPQPRTAPAQPYRLFVSSDGYTLYCGKNNQGNDALLRQVAAPDDVWLHAHRQAGAHVLMKVPGPQEVPHRTLIEAAALAAYYSKGRHAAVVEVLYTQAKHVRKFRGARPGQVQVTEYRTLEIAPRLPDTAQTQGEGPKRTRL
jgi:predicted ribosome quality control (RQC) complex YloA/Tae2 family protein